LVEQVLETSRHLQGFKYVQLASFVMLCYDHLLTFDTEVQRMWKSRLTLASGLWFMSRYLTPLVTLIAIIASNDPKWIGIACENYVPFPIIMNIFLLAVVGAILCLRCYALCDQSPFALIILLTIYTAQLATMIYSAGGVISLPIPAALSPIGCFYTERSGFRYPSTWIATLLFNASIFMITLIRVVSMKFRRSLRDMPLLFLIAKDGIIYLGFIFIANILSMTISLISPSEIRPIYGPISVVISVVAVNRMMLNLREEGARDLVDSALGRTRNQQIVASAMGYGVSLSRVSTVEIDVQIETIRSVDVGLAL